MERRVFMKLRRLAALTGALALLGFSGCIPDFMMPKGEKPVLYLYPPEETTVTVSLSLDGELTCAYPAMEEGGWTVTARPDGALVDEAGREYPYLFWEGTLAAKWDFSSGFVVEGSRTADFLEEKLALLGLTDREAADFITYWLPRMEGNAYNLIAFQQDTYTQAAALSISPAPDTLLRVFMAYRPLTKAVRVPEQLLEAAPPREGFTAVEWGGCVCE